MSIDNDKKTNLIHIMGLGEFSGKKNYYQELEQKKLEYGRIFSEALSGILQVELTGEIIICNPAFWSMCGYVDYRDISVSCKNIKYDLFSSSEEYESFLKKLKQKNRIVGYETKLLKADKSMFYVSFGAHLQNDNGHEFVEFFIEDIDKRKKAERETEVANLFTNNILDASTQVSIISIDLEGIIRTFNKGAERMLGYKAEEFIGFATPEIIHLKEEVVEYGNFLSKKYGESIHGINTFIYVANIEGSDEREWTYIKKDGTKIIVNLSVTAIRDHKNKIIGHLGVAKDITIEKNAQNMVVSMIDAMPSLIIGLDSSMIVSHWNRAVEKITGYKKYEAIGRDVFELYSPLLMFKNKIIQSMASEIIFNKNRVELIEDGVKKYCNITVLPFVIDGVNGGVIRVDNITEQIKLEEMIVQSEKMMSIGGLAAGMAHEINNPLAGIIQNAQNITRRLFLRNKKNLKAARDVGLDLSKLHKYLELRGIEKMIDGITSSGLRASKIIKNMLSFSRNSNEHFTRVNLPLLIENTIFLSESDFNLSKNYDFKNIEIIKCFTENLPNILCDSSKIQQVLYNIFKNGSDALHNSENPRLIIKVYTDDKWIITEIEDNGSGMGEDVRKRIFEPFYTTKAVGKGTGLGMSVSYFIISDLHNGELSVESQDGDWTKFIIKLPINIEE